MISDTALFDYYSKKSRLDPSNSKICLFGLADSGPTLLADDRITNLPISGNKDDLLHFGVFSLMALVQGNHYQEDVALLPVAKYRRFRALIISIVSDGKRPIHDRYLQVVLFLPITSITNIPNPIRLQDDLITMTKKYLMPGDITRSQLIELKNELIQYLNNIIDTNWDRY